MKISAVTLILSMFLFVGMSQNTLISPYNLQAIVNGDEVSLAWSPPDTTSGFYLTYSDENTGNAVGLSSAGSYAVAARWQSSQLEDYQGNVISKLAFYLMDDNSIYEARIWKGENADTVIFTQDIAQPVMNGWTYVTLNNPIEIAANEDIWVGYELTQPAFVFPAGTDFGPAVAGYGDMINFSGEWISMAEEFMLDYNFNIRMYLSDGNESITLSNFKVPATYDYNQASDSPKLVSAAAEQPDYLIGLQGYNVYRNGELLSFVDAGTNSYEDLAPGFGFFQYGVTAVYPEGESSPATATVQVGTPELIVEPQSVSDTAETGSSFSKVITLSNTGTVDQSWYMYATDSWLYASPSGGILQPGEAMDVEVYFFPSGMTLGLNESELNIYDDSYTNLLATVPVMIYLVEPDPVNVYPDELFFGDVSVGDTASLNLTIANNGIDTVEIYSIQSSNPDFTIGNFENTVLPFDQQVVEVSFTTSVLGESNGIITILTSDPSDPEFSIPAFANGFLQSPAFLQASINDDDVTLNWTMSVQGDGEWIHWDDGINYSAIGLTSPGTWQYAARWEAGQLSGNNGQLIQKVAFYTLSDISDYTLKIWKGDNAQTLLVSQPVNTIQGESWNEVVLQNPVTINPSEVLWVGFEVTQTLEDFPAGVDAGPAMSGFGDMVNAGAGWESLTDYGLSYNWNIQFYAVETDSTGKAVSQEIITQNTKLDPIENAKFKAMKPTGAGSAVFSPKVQISDVLGYNVYRDNTQLNSELITVETYTDFDLPLGIYEYGITAVYDIGESDQTTKMVQVGSPQLVFNPESITDTLTGADFSENTVTLSNNGFIDLEWEIASKPDWVTVSPSSGFVEVGEPQDIIITLNSDGLINGQYNQTIVFGVNDQNNPFVNFPINLFVDGQKSLTFSVDTLDFGLVPVSEQKYKQVYVINDGNFPVNIFSTYSNIINFQPQLSTFMLMPGDSGLLTVAFTPTDLSTFTATIYLEDFETSETWELPVTGMGGLAPPNDLATTLDSNTVNLTWYPPGSSGDYLSFSGEEYYTAIGLSGGGTFEVAARFTPQDLLPYSGKMLEKVGFILWDAAEDVTLMVYSGENAENLLLEQDVTGYDVLDWTDVELTTPVSINAVDYLWIGYKITHNQDQFPAGVDAGPAQSGSGDLISLDGVAWETLTYYGLSYNWNIRGSVTDDTGESVVLMPKSKDISDYAGQNGEIASAPANKMSIINNLLGYRVYRNDVLLNDSLLISGTQYTDLNLDPGFYSYEVSAVYELGESLPAGPVEVMIEDPTLYPAGWIHHHTPMTHIIHIPIQSVQGAGFMNEGDWIGVFYTDNGQEKCGGNVVWADNDSLKLIVYGDNPATPVKEGFAFGEWMNWKVFMSQTEQEFIIDVDYNIAMPQHDGKFWMLGESALESVSLTTIIAESKKGAEPGVFPNPARGLFSVSNLDEFDNIRLMDVQGNEVLNRKIFNSTEKFQVDAGPGLYYLILEGKTVETRKLIITK